MKILKENVYAIQLGYDNGKEVHPSNNCTTKEEVKRVEEAKYGEASKPFLGPGGNGAKYWVGP